MNVELPVPSSGSEVAASSSRRGALTLRLADSDSGPNCNRLQQLLHRPLLLARVTLSCPCTLLYSMQVTLMSEPTECGVAVQAQIELVC